MEDLMNLLGAISDMIRNDKLERTEVNGLVVSTVYTTDMGYETAILDQAGVYPVERYTSKEKAEIGHEKWVKDAPTLTTITKLGYGKSIEDTQVDLVREIIEP